MMKHLIICPILRDEIGFITYINELIIESSKCRKLNISILISLQDVNDFLKYRKYFEKNKNIIIVANFVFLKRTQHWQLLCENVGKIDSNDSFSFLFYGDKLDLKQLEMNCTQSKKDIVITNYSIEYKNKTVEKSLIFKFLNVSDERLIHLNFYFGFPAYAPLQKLIFRHDLYKDICFDSKYPYVADQISIISLVSSGYKIQYLRESRAHYTIVESCRRYKINTKRFIEEHMHMYLSNRCYVGFLLIVFKNVIKILQRL